MKAVILAESMGSELKPITTALPKCLVKVEGCPILGYQLDAFRKAGITEVKIAAGFESNKVIEYCKDIEGLSIEFFIREDYQTEGEFHSMRVMKDALKGDDFILCHGDAIFDETIIMKLAESGENISVDTSIGLCKLTSQASRRFFDEMENFERSLSRLCNGKRMDIPQGKAMRINDFSDLAAADREFSEFKLDGHKAIFFDIDGTLAIGNTPIDGAPEFVRRCRDEGLAVHFATNNSSKSKKDYVKKLAGLGIEANAGEIVLSTDGLIDLLSSKNIRRVFCMGTESMKEELLSGGIEHTEDAPEAVVVGYDTELTYAKLSKACILIHAGMDYYVTHMDVVCPSADGLLPDAGTYIKTIEMTTGRSPKAVLGKPNASMLSHLVGPCYKPSESIFVGDRLYTDKVMAQRLGMDFICVLSGETRREDLQALSEEEWPTLIVNSVAEVR